MVGVRVLELDETRTRLVLSEKGAAAAKELHFPIPFLPPPPHSLPPRPSSSSGGRDLKPSRNHGGGESPRDGRCPNAPGGVA
ncbi:unnamed protein product [Closterium sp. NIES-54]